jgi:hypothetical protein
MLIRLFDKFKFSLLLNRWQIAFDRLAQTAFSMDK